MYTISEFAYIFFKRLSLWNCCHVKWFSLGTLQRSKPSPSSPWKSKVETWKYTIAHFRPILPLHSLSSCPCKLCFCIWRVCGVREKFVSVTSSLFVIEGLDVHEVFAIPPFSLAMMHVTSASFAVPL